MQIILVVISAVLSLVSILPWLVLPFDIDFLSVVTFRQKGFIAASLPSIYAFLGLLSAIFLKRGAAKIFLTICGAIFLIFNLVLLFVALIL